MGDSRPLDSTQQALLSNFFLGSGTLFFQTILRLTLPSFRSQFKCWVLREASLDHLTILEQHPCQHSLPHIHTILDPITLFYCLHGNSVKSLYFFVWVYCPFLLEYQLHEGRDFKVFCMAVLPASRIVYGL